MKTNSRPGRSGASRTSATLKPAAYSESVTSALVRKRRVESEVSTAPSYSKTQVLRKVTRPGLTLVTSFQASMVPMPGRAAFW